MKSFKKHAYLYCMAILESVVYLVKKPEDIEVYIGL